MPTNKLTLQMKKTYLAPDAIVLLLSPETALLGGSNGENVSVNDHSTDNDFWS